MAAQSNQLTVDEFTIREHSVTTEDKKHTLYVQEWGNPDGTPILFLHGGPGSGSNDGHKNYFDANKHRVLLVDQRGSGRSTPRGSVEENTTQKLVEDLELIRTKLGLENWTITGGSWGSTLALCYAIKYPSTVRTLVLRGIYLGTKAEELWLVQGGFKTLFPDVWGRFLNRTPQESHRNPGEYHAKQAFGSDALKAKESIYAYSELEYSLLSIDDRVKPIDFEDFDPSSSKVEMHFTTNNCFIEDNYIIKNARTLAMPVYIVQGRYDMVCPPINAYQLHKALPNSTLHWTIAGHSGSDRANYDAIKAILSTI